MLKPENAPPPADVAEATYKCATCRDAGYVKMPLGDEGKPWESALVACSACAP